jgi:hypothetical protein
LIGNMATATTTDDTLARTLHRAEHQRFHNICLMIPGMTRTDAVDELERVKRLLDHINGHSALASTPDIASSRG